MSAQEYHASLLAVALAAEAFLKTPEGSYERSAYLEVLTQATQRWRELERERIEAERGA